MTAKKRPLPVSQFLRGPCPDCNATYRGNELLHELSCPLMGGVELVCAEDARYFEANPDQSTYIRPVTRAELETVAPHRSADGRRGHPRRRRLPAGPAPHIRRLGRRASRAHDRLQRGRMTEIPSGPACYSYVIDR